MNESNQYVVFTLDDRQYALNLFAVERVVRAVEVMPLLKAPETVLGLVNAHGRIIPVINTRQLFRLPAQELNLADRFIIAHTSRRVVALVVDAVDGIISPSIQDVTQAETIADGMQYFEGVINLEDDMILIHNLDRLLSFKEEAMLDDAMAEE